MRLGSRGERGFTFVWALAAVAVLGIGLAVAGPLWADEAQREREQELLRVGALYADAIASYHRSSPGSIKRYPTSLSDLLADTRFLGVRRHLRRLYGDPMNAMRSFGLVMDDGGAIHGVFSTSALRPYQQAPLVLPGVDLAGGTAHYSDWKFVPREMAP